MGRFLLGLVIGIILVPVVVLAYFKWGHVPVAVSDPPFPKEKLVTAMPLEARIQKEMVQNPPVQANEDTFEMGAHIYSEQCAVCHGFHGQQSKIGKHEFPSAPPLWEKHGHGDVIGVSDDPPGETYWKVANGIRLTGMPAYKNILSETEMWQVSILLANADKPLPPEVVTILKGQTATPAETGQAAAGQPGNKPEAKTGANP
jgi:mono/diheme cytochrome c family protein